MTRYPQMLALLAVISASSYAGAEAPGEPSMAALLAYLDRLPSEHALHEAGIGSSDPSGSAGLGGFGGTGGGRGRPLSEKSTINKGTGETIQLDRTYSYDPNGLAHVVNKSKSSNKNPKAVTYENDLRETLDSLGRTIAIEGTIAAASGETIHLDRTYSYDANGLGHVVDRSKSTHRRRDALTYKYDLKETVDQIGRTIGVEGTMAASSGEVIHVRRICRWDANGIGTVADKSWTTHKDPATATYKYDLTEVLNQIFQRLTLKGTVTSSSGRVIPVHLSGTGHPKS